MNLFADFFRYLKVNASENVDNNTENRPRPAPEKSEPKITSPDLKDAKNSHSDIITDEECGYSLYPERRGDVYKPTLWNRIWRMEGRENWDNIRCERRMYQVLTESPVIQLMIGALRSSGCDIDLRRNFSCEVCAPGVNGGYDRHTQQVVICQNNVKNKYIMVSVMAHELIHMYDHCVNKTDFTNLDHLACSEIRAANMTGCSILGSFLSGDFGPLDLLFLQYGKKHATCVKNRALGSVKAARNITEDQAREVIERVFPYCYNDLEPIGRRLRSGSEDSHKAYLEGQYYGYV